MDGEWKCTAIPSEVPRSQSIGVGMSNSFAVWFYVQVGLQIIGVTRGLGYLHDNRMVHGDLEGVSGEDFVILLIFNGSFPRKRSSLMRKALLVSIIFNTVHSTPGREVLLRISLRIVTMPLNIPKDGGLVQTSRMYIPCQCLLLRYVCLSIAMYQGPDRFRL